MRTFDVLEKSEGKFNSIDLLTLKKLFRIMLFKPAMPAVLTPGLTCERRSRAKVGASVHFMKGLSFYIFNFSMFVYLVTRPLF